MTTAQTKDSQTYDEKCACLKICCELSNHIWNAKVIIINFFKAYLICEKSDLRCEKGNTLRVCLNKVFKDLKFLSLNFFIWMSCGKEFEILVF